MQAIILIGPPGSGKGTQAEKIAEKFKLTHIETSKIIEARFKNADPEDPEINYEKEKWLRGELTTPSLFAGWFNEETEKLVQEGRGIVTSGSIRTVTETEIVLPELERLFGKENIKLFYIALSEEESIKRNSMRRICQANRHPIPSGDYDPQFKNIEMCPWDGSSILTRALDKPEVIKKRYQVFLNETSPVLDYLKEQGYKVIEINGEQSIADIAKDIMKHLPEELSPAYQNATV